MPADRPRWRWAAASRIGTSHLKAGTRKQDAYLARTLRDDTLCVVVSDGAGSAPFGGEGASLVCRSMAARLRGWFERHDAMPDEDLVLDWLDDLRDTLSVVAEKRKVTRRQFAATLAMLVVRRGELLALQVGDSSIVGRVDGEWVAICWPDSGEFASTTYFVTDDPEVRLNAVRAPSTHDGFAVFSDGIETIALQQAERRPHPGFFGPMIRPVDTAEAAGKLVDLSAALGRYLDGPAICERTDDDKTLVLVSGA
ncbi:PP2C family serine/threonine-protein phosphatase [Sphingomonas corticis]|uniref:Protein phosphatase 2C domain-containing protein n=1 Tax=Sphingomonas corticis TaxID=2722791 RepID=A0ABX1CSK7_9SPHN|nr:PP2C family serine/threonine-protein phosphatase [Sphingomonas corticis]NJR80296.1 protein phosphatase 2C domain-containing protein [Sphingomonas corticis]